MAYQSKDAKEEKDTVASMQPLLVGNVHVGAKMWMGGNGVVASF